jgi:hypothetical protein
VYVTSKVLDTVAFLAVDDCGQKKIKGTAFFVGLREGELMHAYLVTARHCLDKAKEKYDELYIRCNTAKGGDADYIRVPVDWVVPDDPTVDVAVLSAPIPLSPSRFQVSLLTTEMFATDASMEEYGITTGDNVLIVGLFSRVAGKKRNVPIVRTGIIAAMPGEPLYDRKTGLSFRGYLLEVRSTGGLSGSPVVAYLGYDRDATGHKNKDGREFLIGVVRGHWEYNLSESEDAVRDDREEIEALNMGIAVATPIQEVYALLYREELVKERRARDKKEAQKDAPTDG